MFNDLFYRRLYDWYELHHRVLPWRETEDGYAIWLSEIILQQTRVQQGMAYYERFIARWPRVEDLAAADESEVLREWQGLGYYSRARHLHQAAQEVVAKGWSPFPEEYEAIRSLPGVGDYTAGAIASFAYNKPYAAMDGNVYRVVARLLDIDEAFDTSVGKRLFHKKLESFMDRKHARLFNSAMMELGALQCTPVLDDHCQDCPIQTYCLGYAHGTAALLPVRKPRPKTRDRWIDYHVWLEYSEVRSQYSEVRSQYSEVRSQKSEVRSQYSVFSDQRSAVRTLIRRREEKDIWYHLYEFPGEEHHTEPERCEGGWLNEGRLVCTLTHVLSHQKIHARFFVHKVDTLPDIEGTFAIGWEELDEYALSRLTLRAIDRLLGKE